MKILDFLARLTATPPAPPPKGVVPELSFVEMFRQAWRRLHSPAPPPPPALDSDEVRDAEERAAAQRWLAEEMAAQGGAWFRDGTSRRVIPLRRDGGHVHPRL